MQNVLKILALSIAVVGFASSVSSQTSSMPIEEFCSEANDVIDQETISLTADTSVTIVSCEGMNMKTRYEENKGSIGIPPGATVTVADDDLTVIYTSGVAPEPQGPRAGNWSGGCKYGIVKGLSCKGKHTTYKCVNERSAGNHCAAINDLPCSYNVTLARDNTC